MFTTVGNTVRFITVVFFFNDTATTEIYTLSLHDALPICEVQAFGAGRRDGVRGIPGEQQAPVAHGFVDEAAEPKHRRDRKSTRLNSSHANISYAVFCLKKKHKTYLGAHPTPACPRRHDDA